MMKLLNFNAHVAEVCHDDISDVTSQCKLVSADLEKVWSRDSNFRWSFDASEHLKCFLSNYEACRFLKMFFVQFHFKHQFSIGFQEIRLFRIFAGNLKKFFCPP